MKANLIGATGLVGKDILLKLLKLDEFKAVQVYTRRSTGIKHPKLIESIIDFEDPSWKHSISGDVLFSALGTTLKKAGSKSAQYRVDHDYQFETAKAAAMNGIKTYILVSTVGANSKSLFFYLKMRGELEDKVSALSFSSITIVRPGPLMGEREEPRSGEKFSLGIITRIPKALLLDSWTPVEASRVASLCVKHALRPAPGVNIIRAR